MGDQLQRRTLDGSFIDNTPLNTGKEITDVSTSPDRSLLIVVDSNINLYLLNMSDLSVYRHYTGNYVQAFLTPDNKIHVALDRSGHLKFFDAAVGSTTPFFTYKIGQYEYLSMSPDGKTITVSTRNNVLIYPVVDEDPTTEVVENGQVILIDNYHSLKSFPPHANAGPVTSLKFSPDGSQLAASYFDIPTVYNANSTAIWNVAAGTRFSTLTNTIDYIWDMAFTNGATLSL